MSTPGGDGTSGNDPYRQSPGPAAGDTPYGAPTPPPPPNPYGAPAHPFGSPQQGAAPNAKPPYDGISIASLVLSVLCCTGIVGVILGVVGLVRTSGGRRRGRWAAVTGIVLGVLAIVATTLGVIGLVASDLLRQVTPDNAEVGQCVDIDDDGDVVSMAERECSVEHDGEILYVGEYDPAEHGDDLEAAVCAALVPAEVRTRIIAEVEDPEIGLVVENSSDAPAAGDAFACYLEGDDLTGSVQ